MSSAQKKAPPRSQAKLSNAALRNGVALVEMPFRQYYQPGAGLALLKASIEPLNLPVKILYMTLRLAERVGGALYEQVTNATTNTLIGEWLFAAALFDPAPSNCETYRREILYSNAPHFSTADDADQQTLAQLAQDIEWMQAQIDAFLDECVAELVALEPSIVGFSNAFPQNLASLALAKRVKAAMPASFIVFGGANCTGVMGLELARQFKFVDAVVSGEGEIVFPELVQRVRAGQSIADMPGVYTHALARAQRNGDSLSHAARVPDLDALPLPDYDDYFEQWASYAAPDWKNPALPFETSRGCWWGERSQCTFCGLNGVSLTFRRKTPCRAWQEFDDTLKKHPVTFVAVTDNILDMRYFDDFLPQIAAREPKPVLFFEVKANLKKEHVRRLHASHARFIQPGIESLSTPILRLMRKGITALQNIQLLKWCREFGVIPKWNLLWGFPGEPPDEYRRMAEWIPYLTHLEPPEGASSISLERFSPYFDNAQAFGLANVRPHPVYRHLYPFDQTALANLAFHFDFDYAEPQAVREYTAPVIEQIKKWRQAAATSDLFTVELGEILIVCDLRPIAAQTLTTLVGAQRKLFLACDAAQSLRGLQRLQQEMGYAISAQEILAQLEPLVEQGLMLREGEHFLSLALGMGDYTPKRASLDRFRAALGVQAPQS